MTPLQRFVQYVIIFSALINALNFLLACDRYSRETERRDLSALAEVSRLGDLR
jgi:hypothetical protein